jgi:hypothetical protein
LYPMLYIFGLLGDPEVSTYLIKVCSNCRNRTRFIESW